MTNKEATLMMIEKLREANDGQPVHFKYIYETLKMINVRCIREKWLVEAGMKNLGLDEEYQAANYPKVKYGKWTGYSDESYTMSALWGF